MEQAIADALQHRWFATAPSTAHQRHDFDDRVLAA